MKYKLLFGGILVVLMLVTISMVSAVQKVSDEDETPLYKIRTRLANNEKINEVREKIRSRFIAERIFILPFLRTLFFREPTNLDFDIGCKTTKFTTCPAVCP